MKLHLAKQTDSDPMPPYIIGQLMQELPGAYLLSNALEGATDDTGAFKVMERKFPDFVNRTYVWRVEMLGVKPDLEDFGSMAEEGLGGGMG